MKKKKQVDTTISKTQFKEKITAWKNCLPGNLSNLFYYLGDDGSQRFNNYFSLASDGINKIKQLANNITSLRVYMGCATGEAGETFSPVLRVATETETYYYELSYQIKQEIVRTSTPIAAEIADLFQINWDELSDAEVTDAFIGVTYQKWPAAENEYPIIRRVEYYEFQEDIAPIVACLQASTSHFLRLYMGAGLTIQISHPFNFRPIIAVPLANVQANKHKRAHADEDTTTTEAYFERSRPCPPFCPDNDKDSKSKNKSKSKSKSKGKGKGKGKGKKK